MSSKVKNQLVFTESKWIPPFTDEELEQFGVVLPPHPHIGWNLFRYGTCHGQYRITPDAVELLSIINDDSGNGHFHHLMNHFISMAKKRKLPFRVLEVNNRNLKTHLLFKWGFKSINDVDVELSTTN